jgi:hypothetical protein
MRALCQTLLSRNQSKSKQLLQQWLAALVLVPDLQTVPLPLLDSPLSTPHLPAQTPAVRPGRKGRQSHRTPSLSPSEPDRLDPSHRARTRKQHATARSTRQRRPLFTPLPARAVSWPPLDTTGAPSPAYKRPPFLPEKTHTTILYLLDIVSLEVASWFELAGAGRAPGRPDIPGVPEPPSSRRLDKVEEEELLRRSATRRRVPCLPRRAPPPRPSSPSVSSCAWVESRATTYRFGFIRSDIRAPLVSPVCFFFPRWLSHPREEVWAGPARPVCPARV